MHWNTIDEYRLAAPHIQDHRVLEYCFDAKISPARIKKVMVSSFPEDQDYRKLCQAQKRQCFGNAFRALEFHTNARYVLGDYIHPDHGWRFEHAWIKLGVTYYDPTLEFALGISPERVDYYSMAELTREEAVEIILSRYGKGGGRKRLPKKFDPPALYELLLLRQLQD